jgi:hypothetical protein
LQSKNVREIKEAISQQAMRGTRRVSLDEGYRVINAKTVKGQLMAKVLSTGKWQPVSHINIE